jgi:triphosphoribosyl-dephospho-CoA synthetase
MLRQTFRKILSRQSDTFLLLLVAFDLRLKKEARREYDRLLIISWFSDK